MNWKTETVPGFYTSVLGARWHRPLPDERADRAQRLSIPPSELEVEIRGSDLMI